MGTIRTLISLAALVAASLATTGCSTLQRSSASGYESRGAPGFGPDRQIVYGDDASTLRRAEALLEGRRERDQYFKNKPYIRTDAERLELLSLGSFEERARWLEAHGIFGPQTAPPPEVQALIDVNDITLGMTKQAVRDSWGEPELVEVAGNPLYGNERWAYSEQLPSTEGFQTEKRIVYFEGGRVVGWNSKQ